MSTIDYIIINESAAEVVCDMTIGSREESDHLPLYLLLRNVYLVGNEYEPTGNIELNTAGNRIRWNPTKLVQDNQIAEIELVKCIDKCQAVADVNETEVLQDFDKAIVAIKNVFGHKRKYTSTS